MPICRFDERRHALAVTSRARCCLVGVAPRVGVMVNMVEEDGRQEGH